MRLNWLNWHHQHQRRQRIAAWQDKQKLQRAQNRQHCILYQDFTQVQVQGTFYQVYIQVVYWPDGHGGLNHKFFHFVAATSDEHHDDAFVNDVWQRQLHGV